MTPFEETFIRVCILLDNPAASSTRAEIVSHLDTLVDYSADDDQKRAAYNFKAMALNHIDSIGRDAPDVTETKRVRALETIKAVQFSIEARKSN